MNLSAFLISLFVPLMLNVQDVNNNVMDKPQNIITDQAVYQIDKPFEKTINTFEAWIKLPNNKNTNDVLGTIFGNYYNNSYGYEGSCNYLIDKNGNFRLFYNCLNSLGKKAEVDHTFTNYDFRTGKFEHIALTRNTSNSTFSLYVNGELKETLVHESTNAVNFMRYQVGCDWTNWTKNFDGLYARYPFKGEIKQISVFSSCRTSEEINSDKNTVNFDSTTQDLMGSWNFDNWTKYVIEDDSNHQNHARYGNYEKYIQVEEVEDYDYSLICVPDIQIMNRYNVNKLNQVFDWFVNNKDKKNIEYITLVGDLTDTAGRDDPNDIEWNNLINNFAKLDSNDIAYGFVAGNHDYDDGVGRTRSASKMNQYLTYDKYSKTSYFAGSFYKGDILNYYNIKRINGVDYLFLNLEFGPRDSVLNWASRVLNQYPNHRVVISTHSYVEPNGQLTKSFDPHAPSRYGIGNNNSVNDGSQMFDKFIKNHSNIFIVFSGHNSSDDIIYRTDKGINGNTIHSFLIDAQGSFFSDACDVFSIFKINEAKKEANVYWYSPHNNGYLNYQNQFKFSFEDEFNPTIGIKKVSNNSINDTIKTSIPYICVSIILFTPLPIMYLVKKGNKKYEK